MKPEILAKYQDARVPRYTSYPTAPHFVPDFPAETYAAWLADTDPAAPLSLYLHIPFCAEMCWYCGCHTKITRRYEPIAAYARSLWREIDLVAGRLPHGNPVTHVHFGGGTPTALSADDFSRTMEGLRARFRFAADTEVAVEIDPRTADPERIAALGAGGVTRASLGIQTFDEHVQATINRIQPYGLTRDVVEALRRAGVSALNADLLYGLPYQTARSCAETVDQVLTLEPSRLAVFGYAHVPWMKTHQRMIPENALPGPAERVAQFEAISDRLRQNGYVAVGLDHFAREDDPMAVALAERRLKRNFQGYTTDDAPVLLGLGASAIGALPQGYVQNAPDINGYKRSVDAGDLPTRRGRTLTEDDRLRRAVIERVMCDYWVDLAAMALSHGTGLSTFADALPALGVLEADGVITRDGGHVTVVEAYRPLVRSVAACFDRYLDQGARRHSMAV